MSESDRGRKPKTRLIIGAAIAAALAIGALVTVGLVSQAGYQRDAANQSSQYASYADQKIGQSCIGVAADQLAKCRSEARIEAEQEKRAYEHDQADLVAQRKAALWAEMMGIAALLGMGLSIVGVVLVWITFRETKRGNEIQTSIGEAQTKAYISIPQCRAMLTDQGVPHFGFTIKNSGQSPALAMKLKLIVTFNSIAGKDSSSFETECKYSEVYSVPASDIVDVPLRGVDKPPPEFDDFKFLQCFILLECEWADVFEKRKTDKGVFAFLVEDWPGGVFPVATYYQYMAEIENDRLRRKAKGEWDKD